MSARTHSSRWTTTGCSAGIARRCGTVSLSKEPALNGAVLAAIGPLPKVEQFFSNGARLLDDDFKHFAGWTGLRRFGLDHWGWFETPDKAFVGPVIAHLAVLPHLEWLRLGGCRIGDPAVKALAKIKSLQYVDLFHDQITDEGIRNSAACRTCGSLSSAAVHPRITDASLEHLSAILTLEKIHFRETWLTYAKGFVHLKRLPKLRLVALAKVLATEEDIVKLRADHPQAEVQWTQPTRPLARK